MKFFQEFKDFVNRGNMVDLAVGVVVGGVFTNVVSSFVKDIISPPLGLLLSGINLQDVKWGVFSVGAFFQACMNFFIVALTIFLVISLLKRLRRAEEKRATVEVSPEVRLLTDIRDLLKK